MNGKLILVSQFFRGIQSRLHGFNILKRIRRNTLAYISKETIAHIVRIAAPHHLNHARPIGENQNREQAKKTA